MALGIDIPITDIEEEQEKPSKTYRLDLDSKRIVGTVDGIEAVEQSIRKAILTARYEHLIYDDDYGSEAASLVYDQKSTNELIETELPELIKDALSQDTRILSCENFKFEFENDSCYITFDVNTIFGETQIDVTV